MNRDEERIVRESSKVKDVGRRRQLKVIGGVFLVCLLAAAVAGISSWLTLRDAAEDATDLARQVQMECDKPRVASPQLAQFCPEANKVVDDAPEAVKNNPVEGPPGDTGATGPTGPAGANAPALTEAQILGALRLFCENTGSCRGEDGADATATQVAIAVSSYCNSRGECRGPAGADGVDGVDGVDGEDADPITQGQIIAAVEDYCDANNGCRGPEGQAGQNGQNGSDGAPGEQGPPGIVNVVDDCGAAPEGQTIANVDPNYNPDTQTVVLTCTYKDDQTGILPEN